MSRGHRKDRLPEFVTGFIEDHSHLTREEEQRLAIIINDPESPSEAVVASRNELVSANYRFAMHTIRNYDLSGINMDYDDMFQNAIEGLMKAADKFKPGRGKFCTYAKMWILSKVRTSIEDNIYCVKTSSNTKQKVEMVISIADEMSHIAGELISPQDVAEMCGFNLNEIEVGLQGMAYTPVEESNVSVSENTALEVALEEHLDAVQGVLNRYEYDIIARKFGLGGGRSKSSYDIGRKYCVSGQRIRIIVRNIIKKLGKTFEHEHGGIFLWLE